MLIDVAIMPTQLLRGTGWEGGFDAPAHERVALRRRLVLVAFGECWLLLAGAGAAGADAAGAAAAATTAASTTGSADKGVELFLPETKSAASSRRLLRSSTPLNLRWR